MFSSTTNFSIAVKNDPLVTTEMSEIATVADENSNVAYLTSTAQTKRMSVIENSWIKQCNNMGREYYVNKRNGLVFNPFNMLPKFSIEPRLDFIPKGMSPVLKGHKTVDKLLSKKAKSTLEKYEMELMLFKWQSCISHSDSGKFFANLEKERLKIFRSCVPKVLHSHKNCTNAWRLTVETLKNATVIGQMDKKFIVAKIGSNIISIFDQHAVDERIRLERFKNEYIGKNKSINPITVKVNATDMPFLLLNPTLLKSLSLKFEFINDGLIIFKVPLCLYKIFHPPDFSENLTIAVNKLIIDVIKLIKINETPIGKNGASSCFRTVLNLKACRGAIKFGDQLSLDKCKELICQLALCKAPFRCAHGRPTIKPLLNICDLPLDEKIPKLNFKKCSIFKF